MNQQTTHYLLKQVSTISKKYDDIATVTGERFNIFKILDVTTQEVKMHSTLINSLLNSKGSHGCGTKFLNIFLDQQKGRWYKESEFVRKLEAFDSEYSQSKIEHHIGYINEDSTEGGRIDILITDTHSKHIIIENKINAGDQNKQLLRYYNFDKDKDAPIFYLTLNEKTPSNESKGNLIDGRDYVCISYRSDIVSWIECCIKEAVNLPLLRETLKQYLFLIKALTNQTTNKTMKQEIIELIAKEEETVKSAFVIANSIHELKQELMIDFAKVLVSRCKTLGKTGIRVAYQENTIGRKDTSFDFYTEQTGEYYVSLYFLNDFSDLIIGIGYEKIVDSRNDTINKGIKDFFKQELANLRKGRVENVYTAWFSWAWVTRYDTATNFFNTMDGWSSIPTKNIPIINDIIDALSFMLNKIENVTALFPDVKKQ